MEEIPNSFSQLPEADQKGYVHTSGLENITDVVKYEGGRVFNNYKKAAMAERFVYGKYDSESKGGTQVQRPENRLRKLPPEMLDRVLRHIERSHSMSECMRCTRPVLDLTNG